MKTDQSLQAVANFKSSIQVFPKDVTLLTGLARVYEVCCCLICILSTFSKWMNWMILLKFISKCFFNSPITSKRSHAWRPATFITRSQKLLSVFTGKKHSESKLYWVFRRIMQIGVSNAELFLNIGMCCFACQQYDFALSSIQKALLTSGDSVAADVWYNLGLVMLVWSLLHSYFMRF